MDFKSHTGQVSWQLTIQSDGRIEDLGKIDPIASHHANTYAMHRAMVRGLQSRLQRETEIRCRVISSNLEAAVAVCTEGSIFYKSDDTEIVSRSKSADGSFQGD